MARTILVEVRVEEVDSLDPSYVLDPKMIYEMTPVDSELDGSFEFTCRKSNLSYKLNQMDKRSFSNSRGSTTSQAIYGEPDAEVGDLLRDAVKKLLSGFSMPALDAIVDSVEEAIMPNTVRKRNNQNRNIVREEDEE